MHLVAAPDEISRRAATLTMLAVASLVLAAITPLRLFVDASEAPQKIYHCRVSVPVQAGDVTLYYPKWIPGQHGPVGPLVDVVNLRIRANGGQIAWRRDDVDFYAIHANVPKGVGAIDADFDVVDAPSTAGEAGPTDTPNLMIVPWGTFLMYPRGADADRIPVEASIRLPQRWKYATALKVRSESGQRIAFDTVDLDTLVDSPLDAGIYFKRVVLSSEPLVELDAFADSAAALRIRPELLASYRRLIGQGHAMYASRHYRDYHFLVALTDRFTADGIEHAASSDNRAPEQYFTDRDTFLGSIPDLLAHEFSHSWNGKYWRPAGLATPDFQTPMKTGLLWVYEGLNQYLGEVLATRSGLLTPEQEREQLAMSAAQMDTEGGRTWRPLRDVASEIPLLYVAPTQWGDLRRTSDDVYSEGKLIWAEADEIVRRESHDTRSLDTFLRVWADRPDNGARIVTYTRANLISTMNSVAPFDWAEFFHQRIDMVQARVPLDGLEHAGWRLVYDDKPGEMWTAREKTTNVSDFRYSAGLAVSTDGAQNGDIVDVAWNSPAAKAGIAPGMRVSGVNGRTFSASLLRDAIDDARAAHRPLQLLVSNGAFYRIVSVPVYTGNRYPHLVRIGGVPDLLTKAFEPLM